MASSAPPPPPPPGEPKPKQDLDTVYRPDLDESLTAHIATALKEPELPQQAAVNEVLELLAAPSSNPTSHPEEPKAPAPPADLLGDSPTPTISNQQRRHTAPADLTDLLMDAPAQAESVDLLGGTPPARAHAATSADLLGEAAAPPQNEAVDLLGFSPEVFRSAESSGGLESGQVATGTVAPDTELADFEALLASSGPSSTAAPVAAPKMGINRIMSGNDKDMEKVVDMQKMVATSTIPSHLDLSVPAAGEEISREPREAGDNQLLQRVKEVASTVMPSGYAAADGGNGNVRTEGFGSEDVYGAKARSLTESAAAGAQEAWSKVVDHLPEQVKQYVKVDSDAPDGAGVTGTGGSTSSAARRHTVDGSPEGLETEHQRSTVNRACEGRWVPTYMRQQLVQGGHTELPRGVNDHEHPSDRPPPNATDTFREMGEEINENAQAMFAYLVALASTLALQCQFCSHNTATTVHERVMNAGCCGQVYTQNDAAEDDTTFSPFPDEASAGLGPMRSRVQRTMQGVSLESVLKIAKTKLVTRSGLPGVAPPQLPAAFARVVKARELQRQVVDRSGSIETFFVNTEANLEALPREAVELLGQPGSFGWQLSFRERWRVDRGQATVSAEFSNEHLDKSNVVIAIRLDITDRPDLAGGGCEADSRLYAKPRVHGAMMPLGLVERLTEIHHMQCESLRDAVMGLAEECESASQAAGIPVRPQNSPHLFPSAAQVPEAAGAPLPVVNMTLPANWPPAPEKRPFQTEENSRLTYSQAQEKLKASKGEVNLDHKSLLLQVAGEI